MQKRVNFFAELRLNELSRWHAFDTLSDKVQIVGLGTGRDDCTATAVVGVAPWHTGRLWANLRLTSVWTWTARSASLQSAAPRTSPWWPRTPSAECTARSSSRCTASSKCGRVVHCKPCKTTQKSGKSSFQRCRVFNLSVSTAGARSGRHCLSIAVGCGRYLFDISMAMIKGAWKMECAVRLPTTAAMQNTT